MPTKILREVLQLYRNKLIFVASLFMLSGCDNHHFEDSKFEGEFVATLPQNSVVGDIYPVSLIATSKSGEFDGIKPLIESDNLEIESSEIECLPGEYGDEDLCLASFRVKPLANGESTISIKLGSTEFTNQTRASDVAIIGYMHSNADFSFRLDKEKFEVGNSYPVHFVFANVGTKAANNVTIENIHGGALKNLKSTCGTTLVGGEACYVNGDYIPNEAGGGEGVQYQLTYDEGLPVVVGAKNLLEKSKLVGQVTSRLPLNIAPDKSYDVEFKFKNMGSEPTGTLRAQLLAPAQSKIRFDNCSDTSLANGESCSITASIIADKVGTVTAVAAIDSDTGTKHYASSTTNAVLAPIVASIDHDIPQNMALDDPNYYLATFTNESDTYDATGIRFTHLFPEHYDLVSNTCTDSTLRANESCHISVSASAKQLGVQHYSSYLSFDQGTAVMASSTLSKASNLSINSQVDVNFPPNMVLNHAYPFHVTLTNTSVLDTKELVITAEDSQGATIEYNSCSGVLQPGASCSLSGEYYTTTLGPVMLKGHVDFGSSTLETFEIMGEVVDVPVVGDINVALPHNIGINNSYPFSFVFQNLSSDNNATNIDVTVSSTAPLHVTSNSCQALSTLRTGEKCEIAGEFMPDNEGQHQVSASFKYNEGNEVKVKSLSMVSEVVLSSSVDGASELVGLNEHYTINYNFRNESAVDATGIQVVSSNDLVITSSTCGGTLLAGDSCVINAEYSPTMLGNHTYELSLDYTEGDLIRLNQPVKVVDTIQLGEFVYENGALEHSFAASDYFNLASDYGFTMQTALQTIPVQGNPESVVFRAYGSTPLVFEFPVATAINFKATRRNLCGHRTMNTSIGCSGKTLPSFALTLTQSEYDSLLSGDYSGEIYVSLTQTNNTHVALFKLPIRIRK